MSSGIESPTQAWSTSASSWRRCRSREDGLPHIKGQRRLQWESDQFVFACAWQTASSGSLGASHAVWSFTTKTTPQKPINVSKWQRRDRKDATVSEEKDYWFRRWRKFLRLDTLYIRVEAGEDSIHLMFPSISPKEKLQFSRRQSFHEQKRRCREKASHFRIVSSIKHDVFPLIRSKLFFKKKLFWGEI